MPTLCYAVYSNQYCISVKANVRITVLSLITGSVSCFAIFVQFMFLGRIKHRLEDINTGANSQYYCQNYTTSRQSRLSH